MHDFADFWLAIFHEISTQDVDLRGGDSFQKIFLKICP